MIANAFGVLCAGKEAEARRKRERALVHKDPPSSSAACT